MIKVAFFENAVRLRHFKQIHQRQNSDTVPSLLIN